MKAEAFVYRAYGKGHLLLYVGCSVDPPRRMMDHGRKSPWFRECVYWNAQHFECRRAAEEAELAAIRSENPVYNRIGKDIASPLDRGQYSHLVERGEFFTRIRAESRMRAARKQGPNDDAD